MTLPSIVTLDSVMIERVHFFYGLLYQATNVFVIQSSQINITTVSMIDYNDWNTILSKVGVNERYTSHEGYLLFSEPQVYQANIYIENSNFS